MTVSLVVNFVTMLLFMLGMRQWLFTPVLWRERMVIPRGKCHTDLRKKESLQKFTDGKHKLDQGKCNEIRPIIDRIVQLMTIPLVQGTLRYAYKTARGDNTPKEKAEGVAFLGAVIPQVYECSHEDAEILKRHMWIDGNIKASVDGFKSVKEAFQRNYGCLGIKCSDIGGHLDDLTDNYHQDFRPCTDGVSPRGGQAQNTPLSLGVLILVALVRA